MPGTIDSCKKYHEVVSGDGRYDLAGEYGVSLDDVCNLMSASIYSSRKHGLIALNYSSTAGTPPLEMIVVGSSSITMSVLGFRVPFSLVS